MDKNENHPGRRLCVQGPSTVMASLTSTRTGASPSTTVPQTLPPSSPAEQIFPLTFANATTGGSSTSTDPPTTGLVEDGSRGRCLSPRVVPQVLRYRRRVDQNGCQEVCEKDTARFGIPYFNFSDPYGPSSTCRAPSGSPAPWTRTSGARPACGRRALGVRPAFASSSGRRSTSTPRPRARVSPAPAVAIPRSQPWTSSGPSAPACSPRGGDDDATDARVGENQSCAGHAEALRGRGSNEGGRDDHSDSGKWNVFPGSNFNAPLVPFLDGGFSSSIPKTKAAVAVMPCYGIAYDPQRSRRVGRDRGLRLLGAQHVNPSQHWLGRLDLHRLDDPLRHHAWLQGPHQARALGQAHEEHRVLHRWRVGHRRRHCGDTSSWSTTWEADSALGPSPGQRPQVHQGRDDGRTSSSSRTSDRSAAKEVPRERDRGRLWYRGCREVRRHAQERRQNVISEEEA